MRYHGFQGSGVGNLWRRSPVPKESFTRSQLAAVSWIHRFIDAGGRLSGWLPAGCWLRGGRRGREEILTRSSSLELGGFCHHYPGIGKAPWERYISMKCEFKLAFGQSLSGLGFLNSIIEPRQPSHNMCRAVEWFHIPCLRLLNSLDCAL